MGGITVLSLFVVILCIGDSLGHSWVACTDYRIENDQDKADYSPEKCRGFARLWKNGHGGGIFGQDTGFNYQPGDGATCRDPVTSPVDSGYSSTFPMATYYPGQLVTIAWPPKNHVAASCSNAFIPDFGTKIFVSVANPTSDLTTDSLTLLKDLGANKVPDGMVGYQNCPKFCENNDKALCTGNFTVPTDFQVNSIYTFTWAWSFNADTDTYTTCWEAKIVAAQPGDAIVSDTAVLVCSSNVDCPSGICNIDGYCVSADEVSSGNPVAVAVAIVFAVLFFALVAFMVLYIKFPSKLPGFMKSETESM